MLHRERVILTVSHCVLQKQTYSSSEHSLILSFNNTLAMIVSDGLDVFPFDIGHQSFHIVDGFAALQGAGGDTVTTSTFSSSIKRGHPTVNQPHAYKIYTHFLTKQDLIATHLGNGIEVAGNQSGAHSQPRRRKCGFDPCMSCSDDYDVVHCEYCTRNIETTIV